jgi:hypothetical protein
MKVEIHILTHDDEQMLEWALRHYRTFAQGIVVHDGGPTPFHSSPSFKIWEKYARGIEDRIFEWKTDGQLNDELAMKLKNECWLGTDADWVICVDADELIYFPKGAEFTLSKYSKIGAAMIKPHGFEMFSEQMPSGDGQIYDEIKMGAPEDKWYAKPVLFSPKMVQESGFGMGAHEADMMLKDGRTFHVGQNWPYASPPTWLLHYKHIGGLERVAARYNATRKRLSDTNVKHGWGNIKDDGMTHALHKRSLILPTLRQVIP